jgi:hypothetical protein
MNNPQSQAHLGNSQLDTTLGVLQGGLDNAVDIAGDNISGWIVTLQGSPQFSGINTELKSLHDALRSGATDTAAVARSLQALGEHTTKAAATATPDAQDKLRELGETLTAAASQLKM